MVTVNPLVVVVRNGAVERRTLLLIVASNILLLHKNSTVEDTGSDTTPSPDSAIGAAVKT